jgi:hypothetical protein
MLSEKKSKEKTTQKTDEVPHVGHASKIVTYAKNLCLSFKRKRRDVIVSRSYFDRHQSTGRRTSVSIMIVCA